MKNFKNSSKIIVLALTLALGVGIVQAAWTAAPASPPLVNVDAPINVGNSAQKKAGQLIVNSTTVAPFSKVGFQSFGQSIFTNTNTATTDGAGIVSESTGINPTGRPFFEWRSDYGPINGYIGGDALYDQWQTTIHSTQPLRLSAGSEAKSSALLIKADNTIAIPGGSPAAGKVLTATDSAGNVAWQTPSGDTSYNKFIELGLNTGNNTEVLRMVGILGPGTYTFNGKVSTVSNGGGGYASFFFNSSDTLNTETAKSFLTSNCGGVYGTAGQMHYNSYNSNLLFCLNRTGSNDGSFTLPTTPITTITVPANSTLYMYTFGWQVNMTGYVTIK